MVYIKDFIQQFKALDAYKNASPETEEEEKFYLMFPGANTLRKLLWDLQRVEYTKQGNNFTNDSQYRIRLNYAGYTVVLSKSPDSNHWLLTSWENKKTAAYATGEVRDSAGATAAAPTLNRRNGVNTTVSTVSISTSSEKVNNKNSVRDSVKDSEYLELAKNPEKNEARLGEILDFAVVTSTYSRRKNNVQNLINNSTIYYINENKNRTDKWLSALGLQLPSAITTYDSINRITEISEKVNNKNSIRDSVKDSEYLELAKNPEKNEARLGEILDFAVVTSTYSRRKCTLTRDWIK